MVVTALIDSSSDNDVRDPAPLPTTELTDKPLVHQFDDDDGPATLVSAILSFLPPWMPLPPTTLKLRQRPQRLKLSHSPPLIAVLHPIVAGPATPSFAASSADLNKSSEVALSSPGSDCIALVQFRADVDGSS